MAYDPYKFVNPSFQSAQNANGAAQVADIQGEQNSAARSDYNRDWWKRGLVDAGVNLVKGLASGDPVGAITGTVGGFAQNAADHTNGYQGPGTSSVQASQFAPLSQPSGIGAKEILSRVLGGGGGGSGGVGRAAMQQLAGEDDENSGGISPGPLKIAASLADL